MYIWGYQTPVFIPNLYDRVKKTSFLVKFFPFLGIKCTCTFLSQSGQKNFIYSEIFPFLGHKCTFRGTKKQFLSPSGQKKIHF